MSMTHHSSQELDTEKLKSSHLCAYFVKGYITVSLKNTLQH